MEKIKIAVVDDHPIVREGVIKFLEKVNEFTICGEAGNTEEAIRLINEKKPDVAIVDIALTGSSDGIDLIKAIRDRFPEVRTLCLSMYEESIYAERAIRAGAKGYIQKNEGPDNIIKAIYRIMEGKLFLKSDISDQIISKVMHGKVQSDSSMPVDLLSDREFEVFLLLGNGSGTKEIAQKMNLSTNTVESHKKNIREKLGMRDASELVKAAIQWVLTQKK